MCGIISSVISNSISCCLNAVIACVIGSAVMQRGGHPGYQVHTSAQNGAVGGSILGIAVGVLDMCFAREEGQGEINIPFLGVALGIAFAAAEGALGSKILLVSNHHVQAVKESAIAGAVGSAVLLAAMMALALVFISVAFCFSCLKGEEDFRIRDTISLGRVHERTPNQV